jgi:hypothetical protein
MRYLALIAILITGCAATPDKQQLKVAEANTRALEQMRMKAVTNGEVTSHRGAEVLCPNPGKVFDPQSASFSGRKTVSSGRSVSTKAAYTNEFYFQDRVRTRAFDTRNFTTKTSWQTDRAFETKAAPTKESWFSKRTAKTKTYDTKAASGTDKALPVREMAEANRGFVAKGRRQAEYDSKGPAAQGFGGERISGESWSGDLKPLTIDDVKNILNKN